MDTRSRKNLMDTISFEDLEARDGWRWEGNWQVRDFPDVIEQLHIVGAAKIELRDVETGEVNVWEGHNSVVDGGLNLMLERLVGTAGASPMGNLAIGSGTGAFPGGATGLYSEFYRKAITSASVAANVLTVKTYFTTAQGNDATIRELGLTNAAASGAGTLIDHIEVSPGQAKTSAKEMVITNSLTLSRA